MSIIWKTKAMVKNYELNYEFKKKMFVINFIHIEYGL